MVEVRDHRHEGRDLAVLSGRRRSEDREIAIASEVARATETIHHARTVDVRRVDVTEDISFESRIDGDDTETADDLRIVRVFLGTQQELVLEEVEVAVDLLDDGARHRE